MNTLQRPVFCCVSALDRMVRPEEGAAAAADRFIDRIKAAAAAGLGLIQIREPSLGGAALHRLVVRAVRAVEGTRCRILVNDRIDVALAGGAHGVHLRENSIGPESVRRIVSAPLLVGRSVHSPAEARRVSASGSVDYLIFGTVFPTESKPDLQTPAGVGALRDAVRAAAPVPVLGIGGVTLANAGELARAGAAGVAGIGLFLEDAHARPLCDIVLQLRRSFERSPETAETR